MNRRLSWFVHLVITPATQLSLRQVNKQIYQTHSFPNPFPSEEMASLKMASFPHTLLFHLYYWTLWLSMSVQLSQILSEALKSCRQEDRLRKNCLNNSIAKIILVVINYFLAAILLVLGLGRSFVKVYRIPTLDLLSHSCPALLTGWIPGEFSPCYPLQEHSYAPLSHQYTSQETSPTLQPPLLWCGRWIPNQ